MSGVWEDLNTTALGRLEVAGSYRLLGGYVSRLVRWGSGALSSACVCSTYPLIRFTASLMLFGGTAMSARM